MQAAALALRDERELAGWHRELCRYVHRLTGDADEAEDVAQDALLRLLRVSATQSLQNPRAWLYHVATNLVRDRARRATMVRERALPVDADEPATPAQDLERSERVARVRAVLDRLSARDRELLILRESGFSHREIAEVVAVKPQSVSVLVARALERFRTAYLSEVAK